MVASSHGWLRPRPLALGGALPNWHTLPQCTKTSSQHRKQHARSCTCAARLHFPCADASMVNCFEWSALYESNAQFESAKLQAGQLSPSAKQQMLAETLFGAVGTPRTSCKHREIVHAESKPRSVQAWSVVSRRVHFLKVKLQLE